MQRITDFERKPTRQVTMSARQDENITSLPTGFTARTAGPSFGQVLSSATLPQVQSIDCMVLDVNAVKQELSDT